MAVFQSRSLPPSLRLRAYAQTDLEGCMNIYESNRGHTLPDDPFLLRDFLHEPVARYFVVEGAEGIVGCGGIESRAETNRSDFCFGMVDRACHGRGIGTLLVIARLASVDCSDGEEMILLETSHHTEDFYRRFGFEPVSDYETRYGVGLDYLSMGLWLTPELQTEAARVMREYAKMIEVSGDFFKPA